MSAAAISAEIRSGSWAAGVPASAPGGDAPAAIPGFAGMLLRYVEPLQEWVDDLLGDAAQVDGFASAWEDASGALRALEPEIRAAHGSLAELDGRLVRALRERHQDLADVLGDAQEWTAATAAGLRLAARLVQATRTFVCDLLVQLGRLAGDMFSFTLNPLEAADRIRDFAEAAYEAVAAGGRLVQDLLGALAALAALIQRLIPLLAEALTRLTQILARMMPAVGLAGGGLVGLILGGALENFLQESADVEELDPGTLSGSRLDAWVASQQLTRLGSLSDLVGANGTTDAMGGKDATVIDIKKVVGPDGTVHWVVSLPSTQDWELGSDRGAMNDRDSNVALMLDNPVLRTAYERAVREAMQDAGIPAGADVVLTGFSQGGIMAANLAADDTFPYNTVGVVTNGSPIDRFDIPPRIPVYAFQHATDIVPALDGSIDGQTPPNVHRIVLPDQPGSSYIAAHDNDRYARSVAQWQEEYERRYGTPPPAVEDFYGDVIDHSVFAAAER